MADASFCVVIFCESSGRGRAVLAVRHGFNVFFDRVSLLTSLFKRQSCAASGYGMDLRLTRMRAIMKHFGVHVKTTLRGDSAAQRAVAPALWSGQGEIPVPSKANKADLGTKSPRWGSIAGRVTWWAMAGKA